MHFRQKLTFMALGSALVLLSLFGCGGDEEHESDSVLDEDNQIPTITIKEISREKVDEIAVHGEEMWSQVKIKWRLSASSAPKTDLAVMVEIGVKANRHHLNIPDRPSWVIIPKSQKHSETFSDTLAKKGIIIHPLPVRSVVGEGLVPNVKNLPSKTRGGHYIPEDYDFPLYEVGKPSTLVVEGELLGLTARFWNSTPGYRRVLRKNDVLVIIFTNPPKNVTINGKPATVKGKIATLAGPHAGSGYTNFKIAWDNGPKGTPEIYSTTFNVQP
ncbi:hypothetical protein C6499_19210 [Candidatus Poribacteria bacterium]|nr:MAG: hypothetical protein C6499_19210 [Candidatus Poribacteria bacterium]